MATSDLPTDEVDVHTRGPWKIYETRYKHYLNGEHIERNIGTEWDHAQLKGPVPIATVAIGVGETEGAGAIKFLNIDEMDAKLIAAAPELLYALSAMVNEFPALDVTESAHEAYLSALAAIKKATT